MTILKPGLPRRNPVGRHRCVSCDALLHVGETDVPPIDSRGEQWISCPCCGRLVHLNPLGATEPPVP